MIVKWKYGPIRIVKILSNCAQKSIVICEASNCMRDTSCKDHAKCLRKVEKMNSKERIDRIEAERKRQGLSIQQLADMSQVSSSTVHRAVNGKTVPSDFTIQTMELSLGISDDPQQDHLFEEGTITPLAERYIATLELRIARLRAHYNMLIATKDRWLILSFAMNIVLISFMLFWILCDLRNPSVGWIR